jgi:hypothetical protein
MPGHYIFKQVMDGVFVRHVYFLRLRATSLLRQRLDSFTALLMIGVRYDDFAAHGAQCATDAKSDSTRAASDNGDLLFKFLHCFLASFARQPDLGKMKSLAESVKRFDSLGTARPC